MKKIFYIMVLIFLLPCMGGAKAQRMMVRQRMLEINYGVSLLKNHAFKSEQFNAGIHATFNKKNGKYFRYGLNYNHLLYPYQEEIVSPKYELNDINVPVDDFTADFGYFIPLFNSAFRFFSVDLGPYAIAGYEMVNNGKDRLPGGSFIDSKSSIIGGAGLQMNFCFYVLNNMQFIVGTKTDYLFGTQLSALRPNLLAALRFHF